MLENLRSITVCVDYDDLLAVTLPRNLRFLGDRTVVVTAPHDTRTRQLCDQYGVETFVTDAFYRNGARFNKGLALEEGLDFLGRFDGYGGWYLIWDADTLFPVELQNLQQCRLEHSRLYNMRRRICDPASRWRDDLDWQTCPVYNEHEHPGYFQLFHASDPRVQSKPWYGTDSPDASRCDSVFQFKWPQELKTRLPMECLHLGPHGTNWCGRLALTPDA